MANTSTDAVNTNKKDGSAPIKNDARDAALKAAAQRPPYDASALGNTSTRDLVPAMPTHLSAPGVNLGAYINTVHQIPILTPVQEQELAHRYYDEGDVEAARLLVMSHLRFVIHIARSYSGYGLPQADLIQEGNLGLMKAVKRFDPNKGVRLVSFAVHWIKAEIHEFVIRNWRIVKVATTKAHRKLFFNLRSLKKTNNQLTLEEADAIANDLNVTRKQVLEMESRLTSYDASFEAQSSDDDDGRYAPQLFLEDGIDPAEQLEEAVGMIEGLKPKGEWDTMASLGANLSSLQNFMADMDGRATEEEEALAIANAVLAAEGKEAEEGVDGEEPGVAESVAAAETAAAAAPEEEEEPGELPIPPELADKLNTLRGKKKYLEEIRELELQVRALQEQAAAGFPPEVEPPEVFPEDGDGDGEGAAEEGAAEPVPEPA